MLLGMACQDTEYNERSHMTDKTIHSLNKTVDWNRHRLVVSDNGSCKETQNILQRWARVIPHMTIIHNGKNIGTANAVNRAWSLRRPNEACAKLDNDVVIREAGWADTMEWVFAKDPTVGIAALKRKDLAEHPKATNKWYISTLEYLHHKAGEPWVTLEEVQHAMGTCQAFSALALKKMGYLYQMDGLYGFDDSLASSRVRIGGFRVVFLPKYEIDHIDPGGTKYTEWKSLYAGRVIDDYVRVRKAYESGKLPIYYDGGETLKEWKNEA